MESQGNIWVSGALAAVFALFALLQINDPDPFAWILVYGFVAAMLLLNIWRRLPYSWVLLPMAAALVGAWLLWPDSYKGLEGKMDSRREVELARESLGLVLCALAFGYLFLRSYVRGKRKPVLV
jgi:hypothetical protein